MKADNFKNIVIMMKYYFFFIALLAIGCTKAPQPTDPTQPKLIWKTALQSAGLTGSIYPVVCSNSIIYSNWTTGGTTEQIIALNKSTGKREWEWNDYQSATNNSILDGSGYSVYMANDKIMFPIGSRNYAIDIKTGKTLWSNKGDAAEKYISGLGDICFQIKSNQSTGSDLPYVSKCNINTGQWQTVFTDTVVKDFKPSSSFPLPYIDTNGDTLIYYIKNLYKFPPNEAIRSLIYCFNISKNRMIYSKDIFPAEGVGGFPIIYKNRIYIYADKGFVCLDMLTGNKVWANNSNLAGSGFTTFTVAEGKVLAGNSNSKLYCYDAETGALIWEKDKATANTNDMNKPTVLNGILYYVSLGKLYAVDILTGEFLWQYKANTGDSNLFLNRYMTVDPVAKRIYAHDFRNAYCFEAIK